MPAYHELVSNYFELEAAESLDDGCLLWIAWTLHHRIAGQPISTVADFLHDSIYKIASAAS